MSGIYIPGLMMPQSWHDCVFSSYNCGAVTCKISKSKGKFCNYPSRCPLVPVPDHGDLIDRDKLRKTMFIGEQCLYSWDEVEDAIDYAPTIIPAEEGE